MPSVQISFTASTKLRPHLAAGKGLTPSASPVVARSRISAISAVSMKIFMIPERIDGPTAKVYPMPDSHAILLPLPLAGSYDYRGADVTPGDFVVVPLGKREQI